MIDIDMVSEAWKVFPTMMFIMWNVIRNMVIKYKRTKRILYVLISC